jgi:hypothetical protein
VFGYTTEELRLLVAPMARVGEEALGSMGMPHKVTVEGDAFFLCCGGCEREVRGDPAATRSKVAELRAKRGRKKRRWGARSALRQVVRGARAERMS